jgi:L-alanine-DL-glutamate epimerase-like enolase superfamily enzyme
MQCYNIKKPEEKNMRIQSLETFVKQSVGFVRLTSDDGRQSWGQFSTFNADITAQVFHRQVAPHALGADPADWENLVDRILEAEYKFPGSYVCRALCGLDTAIWDLRGKAAGKSVCQLLGGKPGWFPVYGSSMRRDITPQDEAARLAKLRDQLGYRAFKIRVGKVNGHDQDQWPGRSEALIPTVRKAVGDQVVLLADGNSCYTPRGAIEIGQQLEANGYGHFEEPCPYWELEWTAEVAAALSIPVAGGEQDYDLNQWPRIIQMKAVDIVQPDIGYIGGLTRALRVAQMAQEAGLPCVPHSANRAMVVIFSLHMMGAIPNAGPHVEFSIEAGDWQEGLYTPAPVVVDGKVKIPDGPGWGVEVNPAWLQGATYQKSEIE